MPAPDILRPFAQSIGRLLSRAGERPEHWQGYDPSKEAQLTARDQTEDEKISFYRSGHGKDDWNGCIELSDIKPDDIVDVKIHEPVVLKSTPKSSARITLDNPGKEKQSQTLTEEFKYTKNVLDEVKAGFSTTSETTFGTGEGAAVKFEQKFSVTVASEWTKQTAEGEEHTVNNSFPVICPPYTKMQAWIEWNQSDMRRHTEGYGTYECQVRIGNYNNYKKVYDSKRAKKTRRWRWYNDCQWDSIRDLLLSVKGRGSVKFDLAKHFRDATKRPRQSWIDAVEKRPRTHFDHYTTYKDVTDISVRYETIKEYPKPAETTDGE